jgi:hypothetical protein
MEDRPLILIAVAQRKVSWECWIENRTPEPSDTFWLVSAVTAFLVLYFVNVKNYQSLLARVSLKVVFGIRSFFLDLDRNISYQILKVGRIVKNT